MTAAWSYLALVAASWLALWRLGDAWWAGTLLLFSPRWVIGVPLVLVLPMVLLWCRRWLLVPLVSAAICFGPMMGLCVPLTAPSGGEAAAQRLRVMTVNAPRRMLLPGALESLIEETQPDIVALQEWTGEVLQDPVADELFGAQGRGVSVCSRFPILDSESFDYPDDRWSGSALRCEVAVVDRSVTLFVVHLPTPRAGLEACLQERHRGISKLRKNIDQRARYSEAVRAWVDRSSTPIIVLGDFNLPTESAIYQRHWSGLTNAFSAVGCGYGHTKHTRWHGIRIDHVLTSSHWQPVRCWIGPDIGSDHRPVIADLVLR